MVTINLHGQYVLQWHDFKLFELVIEMFPMATKKIVNWA